MSLNARGEAQVRLTSVQPLQQPVRLLLSPEVMRADDLLLAHKTTLRRVYDDAWRAAEQAGAFDALFFNERGELTEGGRSNVLVKLGGQWFTPPRDAGLLPGVMRSLLLEDPAWAVQERVITRADLQQAEEICVCNALRGVLRAVLD